MTAAEALQVVASFDPGVDGLARKSKDLAADLLQHGKRPFARDYFKPGHITCTALVRHPREAKCLLMLHHRLQRWLLPGGHVEESDASLAETAGREAFEETSVALDPGFKPFLAGIDVHGIPPKRDEPFHLHHDLIWCFRAATDVVTITHEAPSVLWAGPQDSDRLEVAESIRQSILRAEAR